MKRLLFIFLFLLILQPVFSQSNNDSFLKEIGVLLGPGYSTVNGGESWTGAFGFQAGLESQIYKMDDNSSIYAGILFSLQGSSYEETGDVFQNEGYSGKVTLGYISIPILYNYRWDSGLYGEAGIQPGFLVSAKDKYNGGESYDYSDYINSFDFGIPVGAGFWINDMISVGARAVFGLSNINNSDAVDYGEDPNDKNLLIIGVIRVNINSN